MEGQTSRRIRRSAVLIAIVGLLVGPDAVASQDSPQTGIHSSQAFAHLLNELSSSDDEAQPQLMSRGVVLPDSELKRTVASVPLAQYEVDAKPNSIGLQNVKYTVLSDRDGSNLRLLRAQFFFLAGEQADRTTCAQFDDARTALGLDTKIPAAPMPLSREVVSSRARARSIVFVSADVQTKTCLRSALVQFHERGQRSTSTRREELGSHEFGFDNEALRAFTGTHGGDYITGHELLSEQLWIAMGIPDGFDRQAHRSWPLKGGYVLSFGCRQHNCPEKGAVIADEEGRVVRAALISFNCKDRDCASTRTLTIFKSSEAMGRDEDQDMLDEELMIWAQQRLPGTPLRIVVLD